MRYFWLCWLLAGTVATGSAQPPRTPDGMLWAGTTFQLRAIATSDTGQTLSLSPEAQITVGVVSNWRIVHETENAQTVAGSEGWFTFVVANRGNAIDWLNWRIKSNESRDASPWDLMLFEEREDGSGFSSGAPLSDKTSPLAPCEARRLYLRVRPPSNRLTDGVFVEWIGLPQQNPTTIHRLEFAAGTESAHNLHTTATTWNGHTVIGEPQLIQGRLYWLTWDSLMLRLYRTPNPLSVSTPFNNNISMEARIHMSEPTHNTVLMGDHWYLLTRTGQIVFFSLAQAQGGRTLNAFVLDLPEGVSVDAGVPLTRLGTFLCFADRQNRIWLFNPTHFTFTQLPYTSSQPITVLAPIDNGALAVGRADGRVDIYQGDRPALSNLRVPGAGSQAVRFLERQGPHLLVAAGTRVGMYHLNTRKWHSIYVLESAPVAPPAYDARTDTLYVLTQQGWLHGYDLAKGGFRPLYPHRLFSEPSVARATLHTLTRANRDTTYLYLQAQLSDGTVRTMFITGEHPLNRFVNPQIPPNVPVGTRWLFTGDTEQDLALCWVAYGAGSEANRGAFYGFRLR
ncbi:MAG: hypothetical protein P3X24_008490 [bacterium]|nr:hypothetical protein [bacterium]